MGLFSKKSDSLLKDLQSSDDLEQAVSDSHHRVQFLLKHSTRCPVSFHALAEYQDAKKQSAQPADWHMLDLLKHRSLSDEMAERFGITHQSPQVFVLKDGQMVDHASHGTITLDWLLKHL